MKRFKAHIQESSATEIVDMISKLTQHNVIRADGGGDDGHSGRKISIKIDAPDFNSLADHMSVDILKQLIKHGYKKVEVGDSYTDTFYNPDLSSWKRPQMISVSRNKKESSIDVMAIEISQDEFRNTIDIQKGKKKKEKA